MIFFTVQPDDPWTSRLFWHGDDVPQKQLAGRKWPLPNYFEYYSISKFYFFGYFLEGYLYVYVTYWPTSLYLAGVVLC